MRQRLELNLCAYAVDREGGAYGLHPFLLLPRLRQDVKCAMP